MSRRRCQISPPHAYWKLGAFTKEKKMKAINNGVAKASTWISRRDVKGSDTSVGEG